MKIAVLYRAYIYAPLLAMTPLEFEFHLIFLWANQPLCATQRWLLEYLFSWFDTKLDSMRNPSPQGGHAMVSSVAACCVRRS